MLPFLIVICIVLLRGVHRLAMGLKVFIYIQCIERRERSQLQLFLQQRFEIITLSYTLHFLDRY